MKKFVVNIFFVLFIVIINNKLIAQNNKLVDFNELKEIINNKIHGDVIYIKNGIYKDINITIKNLKPVTIKAETPGKVILKGETQIRLQSCNNIVLSGFYFDGTKSKQLIKLNNVKESKIENNYFKNSKGYSPYSCIIGIQDGSQSNLIVENTFEGIETIGILIDDGLNTKNIITKNIFKNIPSVKSVYPNTDGNGMECIGLGKGLKLPIKDLYTTVSFNYFENIKADGMEIICVKSNSNEIKNNYFTRNQGGVSLRRGDYTTIDQNIFINTSQNIRIFGIGHIIKNNYIDSNKKGIQLPASNFSDHNKLSSSGYYQAKNITINNNTFRGMDNNVLVIGENSGENRKVMPENIMFERNELFNSSIPTVNPNKEIKIISTKIINKAKHNVSKKGYYYGKKW